MGDGYKVIKEWAKSIFKFLKKEKNLGAVTWITTAFVTLSVALLKFFSFVSESGKLKYWNISTSAINVASDNILYDIIITVVFAAVVLFIFLIPYFIIKSKAKKWKKVIILSVIVVTLSILFYFGSNARAIIHNSFWTGVVAFIIADLFFIAIVFAPTFALLISSKPPKNTSKTSTKATIAITIIVFLIFNIFYFYIASYFTAMTETRYRITTDNQYAIVYETEEVYYLSKYDESKNEINKNHQKIISKEGVEYAWKTNIGVK